MLSFLRRLGREQRAVTSIEYTWIICLISAAAIGAMTNLGQTLFNVAGPIAMALH